MVCLLTMVKESRYSTASDTPAYNSSTNFYTANAWSGAVTVAGTQEAITRWGIIKHFTTDLSSGYLPVGPDLNTGRSGSQYYTFAFRRQVVANIDIKITAPHGIEGCWIALPGSNIDASSGLNGCLECTSQYNGVGVRMIQATVETVLMAVLIQVVT